MAGSHLLDGARAPPLFLEKKGKFKMAIRTLREAMLRKLVSPLLLDLWMSAPPIKEKTRTFPPAKNVRSFRSEAQLIRFFLVSSIGLFFLASVERLWPLNVGPGLILLLSAYFTHLTGPTRKFVHDAFELAIALGSHSATGLLSKQQLEELAREAMVAALKLIIEMDNTPSMKRYGFDPNDKEWENAQLSEKEARAKARRTYNALARFGLVSGGYGPFYRKALARRAQAFMKATQIAS